MGGVRDIAAGVLLVGFAWALFGHTLTVPFILDDLTYIAGAHEGGVFSWSRLWSLAWPTEPEFTFNHHLRPIGYLSIGLDENLFGLHPAHFRAVAITLHGLVGVAVMGLARGLGASPRVGAIAGALFVAHPGGFEAVIWVCHRFTLLAALWFALTAAATVRLARRGRGYGLVFCLALAALLSKDSMIGQLLALPVLAAAVAKKERMRILVRTGLVIGSAIALDLLARRLLTGAWLPGLGSDGSVVETLEAAAILRQLPGFLWSFAAPLVVHDDDALPWTLLRVLAGGLAMALTGLGIAGTVRGARGSREALCFLVTLVALSFPVLSVGESLAGARRFYVLSVAFFPWLGLAVGRRAVPLLMVLALLYGPMLWKNQLAYHAITDVVREVDAAVEGDGGDNSVLVAGLPEDWRGTPLFGRGLPTFSIRFQPPLRSRPRSVIPLADETAGVVLMSATTPARLLVFRLDRREGGDSLEVVLDVAWPGDPSPVSRGLDWHRPAPDTRWPAGSDAVAEVSWQGTLPDAFRVRLTLDAGTWEWIIPGTAPHVSTAGGRVRIDFGRASSLVPLRDTRTLWPHVIGRGTPATLWIEALNPSTSQTLPLSTGPRTFLLGGRTP